MFDNPANGLTCTGIFYSKSIMPNLDYDGKNSLWYNRAQNFPFIDSNNLTNYHSNEKEPRPKTKFFSLLIYAGYPMQ